MLAPFLLIVSEADNEAVAQAIFLLNCCFALCIALLALIYIYIYVVSFSVVVSLFAVVDVPDSNGAVRVSCEQLLA
jgi:hypothetical protein